MVEVKMSAYIKELDDEFCENLHELSGYQFPLKCPQCNAEYYDIKDFISRTNSTDNLQGVYELEDIAHHHYLEIIRMCSCKKILKEDFDDRRSEDAKAQHLRKIFSDHLRKLRSVGFSRSDAHEVLMDLLNKNGEEAFEETCMSH